MPGIEELKQRVLAEVDGLRAEMDEVAHDIHQHPEVGWETPRSAERLCSFLEKHGLKVERGVAGLSCAFRGYAEERFNSHPAVCLLAEFDALPGLGHACGHNLIGTVACGAGIAVTRVLREAGLPGVVYVMGTPFEEGGGGKIIMLREGVFDVADASLMFHPGPYYRAGGRNIAAHMMKIRFYGKAAHAGGSPHEGINAADAAMITFTAVNALRQHVTPDVRIHGIITKGGDAPNIIPDFTEISMIVRAATRRTIEPVIEKVRNCARAGALATGCRVEIEDGLTFYERVILPRYRRVGLDNMRYLGLPADDEDPQTYGSADSGNVSHKIPHLTFQMPIHPDPKVRAHTPEYAAAADSDMARQTMNHAAKVMALCALDVIINKDLLPELQRQHQEILAGAAG